MDIKRPPKWKRLLKKTVLSFAVAVAAVAAVGFLVQHHRDADFRTQHPAPGSFVKVDGRQVHFRQSGDGDFTFVLEAGLGDYSGSWGTLAPALAEIGRVFVYDRAGLGWSEESPHPRTARHIASELHDVLESVHARKPYILVGHSLGGVSQFCYALDYPDEVAGLLLIDPSHKDQLKRLPAPPAIFTLVFPQITRTAPFGLPQLLFRSPDPVQNQTRHVQSSGAELRAFLNIAETWGDRPLHLGNMPIYVLTAGDYKGMPGKSDAEKRAVWEIWRSLHAELAAASSSEIRKQEIIEGASHNIHRTHPAAVVEAAKELVDRIRARTPRINPRD